MNNHLLGTGRARQVYALAWVIMMGIEVLIMNFFGLYWRVMLIDVFISNALLAGAGCVLVTMFHYYLPAQNKFSYVLMICLAMTLLWYWISRGLLYYFTDAEVRNGFGNEALPLRLFIGTLALTCVSLMGLLWRYMTEQRELEQRREEASRELRDAELFKLRQQLQPHFLFNALNSISALTGAAPERARHMIQQLSEFLRGTLRKEERTWISLKEEMHHIGLYLEIEKVRFGHRLQTEMVIEPDCGGCRIPALLLQPILENAIKFGLYDTTGEVKIVLRASQSDKRLVITVSNPFDPETSSAKGTGFGLSSVKRRLTLLFSRSDLVLTASRDNIFYTSIIIPQDLYESHDH